MIPKQPFDTAKLPFLNNGVAQVALVVKDLDKTVENYYKMFGIGPWHFYRYERPLLKHMSYHGKETEYSMRVALSYFGTTRVELIEMQWGDTVYADFVKKQLECVLEDIPPDAVKIGMLFLVDTIFCIAETLDKFGAKNIVLDPVMLSTSGKRLLDETAESILIKKLFPLSDLVTPNIHEAEKISGIKINSIEDIKKAASLLSKRCKGNVLVKGGHFGECIDVLYFENQFFIFDGKRINNPNTHGTGCTLSSAIACSLAAGKSIPESVMLAKEYVSGAIGAMLDIGKGRGPLDHFWNLK